MPNSYKDIIITPNRGSSSNPSVAFRGGNTASNTEITLRVYPESNGTLAFEGSAGQLLSITNDLSNTIFSVNDVSGIPSLEVFANGAIYIAQYSGNVGIGTNSTSTYKFFVNGDAAANNFYSLSDATVKTDITGIPNSLDLLNKINAVEFKWKESGAKSYGVLAQEIEKILPELVATDSDGRKSVSYIPLIALLIDAIKQLSKEISRKE